MKEVERSKGPERRQETGSRSVGTNRHGFRREDEQRKAKKEERVGRRRRNKMNKQSQERRREGGKIETMTEEETEVMRKYRHKQQ